MLFEHVDGTRRKVLGLRVPKVNPTKYRAIALVSDRIRQPVQWYQTQDKRQTCRSLLKPMFSPLQAFQVTWARRIVVMGVEPVLLGPTQKEFGENVSRQASSHVARRRLKHPPIVVRLASTSTSCLAHVRNSLPGPDSVSRCTVTDEGALIKVPDVLGSNRRARRGGPDSMQCWSLDFACRNRHLLRRVKRRSCISARLGDVFLSRLLDEAAGKVELFEGFSSMHRLSDFSLYIRRELECSAVVSFSLGEGELFFCVSLVSLFSVSADVTEVNH